MEMDSNVRTFKRAAILRRNEGLDAHGLPVTTVTEALPDHDVEHTQRSSTSGGAKKNSYLFVLNVQS